MNNNNKKVYFCVLTFFLKKKSQQAKKCAKTVVAPHPQVLKKVQLPSHFQFFNDNNEDEKDRPSENWRKGYIETFKSYQKCKQKAKSLKQHKEITSIEEAYSILYAKEDKVSIIPTLSQVNNIYMFDVFFVC